MGFTLWSGIFVNLYTYAGAESVIVVSLPRIIIIGSVSKTSACGVPTNIILSLLLLLLLCSSGHSYTFSYLRFKSKENLWVLSVLHTNSLANSGIYYSIVLSNYRLLNQAIVRKNLISHFY